MCDFKKLLDDSPNFVTLINFNIRSYHANSDAFFCIFDEQNLPDIFVLTETWFSNDNALNLHGYSSYHTIRSSRRSGGVSVFVKNSLESYILPDLCLCNDSIEICSVNVTINNSTKTILGVYRPHADSPENFTLSLNNIINNRHVNKKSMIITGDFNINILDNSPISQQFINNMHSYNFFPLIMTRDFPLLHRLLLYSTIFGQIQF